MFKCPRKVCELSKVIIVQRLDRVFVQSCYFRVFNILRHICYMEAKSSSQMGAFFRPMSANCFHTKIGKLFTCGGEFFYQIEANLPVDATEITVFKAFKSIFLQKKWVFRKKSPEFLQNRSRQM